MPGCFILQNYIQMGRPERFETEAVWRKDSNLVFKLKVIRSFINMVVIRVRRCSAFYVTTSTGDALSTPVYTISYSGKVEVPQNCEVNAGQIVEFDFGILAHRCLARRGRVTGPKALIRRPKTVAIKCTNVAAQAYLTMRVEAEKATGQMMVSDNPDLGFIVADSSGTAHLRLTICPAISHFSWMITRSKGRYSGMAGQRDGE
jgi:minor fimbrial subunit